MPWIDLGKCEAPEHIFGRRRTHTWHRYQCSGCEKVFVRLPFNVTTGSCGCLYRARRESEMRSFYRSTFVPRRYSKPCQQSLPPSSDHSPKEPSPGSPNSEIVA